MLLSLAWPLALLVLAPVLASTAVVAVPASPPPVGSNTTNTISIIANSVKRPQHYIHFGSCTPSRERQDYGNWVMTRPRSKQTGPESIVLYLDTKNASAMAPAFPAAVGPVKPTDFSLNHIYFGIWNKSGVKTWGPKLDKTGYKEMPSWYTIKVSGKTLMTLRDLKDSGPSLPLTTSYCLKGTLRTLNNVRPAGTPFKIEIKKSCDTPADCAKIPDPLTVFTSPAGYIAWSIWSVHQPLTVNGTYVKDHGWCPVQTVVDTD